MTRKIPVISIFLILIFIDCVIWSRIVFGAPNRSPEIYGLDVGQGDSELVVLPGGIKILIDGGPNNKIIKELDSALGPNDRYLDLIILSHPQTDHLNGLIEVLKRYRVGVFIYNGQKAKIQSFSDLEKTLQENEILSVALAEGDNINYKNNIFQVLSPSKKILAGKKINDTALVLKLTTKDFKALFTGDIESKIEEELAKKYDLDIDILKVSHHGSKYSTSEEFLNATTPKIALIEVGKNSYGHPTPDALQRLKNVGAQIFRTDLDGIVKLAVAGAKINIFTQK